MKNRQHSRLLTTLVLVAALSVALGAEAFAAGSTRSPSGSRIGLKFSKPTSSPLGSGEPDVPNNVPPPPPKVNPYSPYPGGIGPSDWALRIHWSLRVMLLQLPKRFP